MVFIGASALHRELRRALQRHRAVWSRRAVTEVAVGSLASREVLWQWGDAGSESELSQPAVASRTVAPLAPTQGGASSVSGGFGNRATVGTQKPPPWKTRFLQMTKQGGGRLTDSCKSLWFPKHLGGNQAEQLLGAACTPGCCAGPACFSLLPRLRAAGPSRGSRLAGTLG